MVTHIETDDEGRFKMCFIAFGFTIRSFLAHMRPLLITDGAHLKGTYKGTNLVLVRMDENNQIVPIAIGVSQGETEESWTWYLMMNCKMKSDKLQALYWKTCKAYTPEEFQRRVSDLRDFRPEAYKKLEEAGFETWSRAMCPADRYNYMTSNSAESINNLTRHVRIAPITQLMEWYRALLQKWHCARRDKYKDFEANTLSDWATHKVMDRMQKSAIWNVHRIEYGRLYQVDDRRRVHQVDLTSRTCTCRKWSISFCGYRNGDIPFCNQLFPEKIGYDVKIIDLFALFDDEEKFSKLNEEDAIRLYMDNRVFLCIGLLVDQSTKNHTESIVMEEKGII
nr:hypothetical protein [Tanacetum cinerariifolium]